MTTKRTAIRDKLISLIDEIDRATKAWKLANKAPMKIYRGRSLISFEIKLLEKYQPDFSDFDPVDVERPDWKEAVWNIFHGVISKSLIYVELLGSLPKSYSRFTIEMFQYFVAKCTSLHLEDKAIGYFSKSKLAEAYLKELEEKPLERKVEMDISGILMEVDRITISPKTYLTKTSQADVEEPIPVEDFIQYRKHGHYSLATLHTEYDSKRKSFLDFQEWTKILTILRLYSVADVRYSAVTVSSESSYPWYSGIGKKEHYSNDYFIFGALITKKDEPKLSRFWRILEPIIPDSFRVPESESDQLAIAYQRYLEAMHNGGHEEMRIAYGISALEALLSVSQTELNYRLKMRSSRILGILGLNPKEVYDAIDWAYKVRSAFDHGDRLDSGKRMKIRKFYNAKDERILTIIILDYVRICLVSAILTKWNKSDLLDLIDDSWVSTDSLSNLKKLLRKPKTLLKLDSYRPKYSLSPFNDAMCSFIVRE